MAYANLRVEHRGPAALVTIDRPKVLNALDAATLEELTHAVRALGAQGGVHGIVLAGAGEKAFVAGADIAAMATMAPLEAMAHSERGHALLLALLDCPKVTIAAVHGYALGGGLELALACDLRLGTEDCTLGLPEVGLGVIPGFGGTQRLARLVGEARAKELVLTGDRIKGPQALQWGLLNKVVPRERLLEEAVAIVERVARNGPLAVRTAKDVLQRGLDLPLPALALEARAFGTIFATHDQREGMKAFLEKRPPRYEGR
jgi:enoyl-CoA hydratase